MVAEHVDRCEVCGTEIFCGQNVGSILLCLRHFDASVNFWKHVQAKVNPGRIRKGLAPMTQELSTQCYVILEQFHEGLKETAISEKTV